MHTSRFTVAIETPNGEHILYSSSTGAIAVAGSAAWSAFTAPDAPDASTALVAEFAQAGFLTALTADEELARIRNVFDAERADSSTLGLVIAPTYACNYRCPYCYEQGHNAIKGVMDAPVIDAIADFVAERWAATGFAHLSVQWYGGDPSLALPQVEELSQLLIAFCDAHGIAYSAMMLTNCNLIDEDAIDLMVRCRIGEIFITVDGPEDIHNARRVAADGSNSFAKQLEAARLAIAAGINVRANMNADKVNLPRYAELAAYLRDELGIALSTTMLCDYGHFFGTREFKKPAFDLFTHKEYAQVDHDAFVQRGFTAEEIRGMLRPIGHFCGGQRDAYFVIDVKGDVYLCDGVMGERDRIAFNLLEGYAEEDLHRIVFDATRDEKCAACELLPVCLGNCIWERRRTEIPCHPLKYTLRDYLLDLRGCYGELDSEGLTLL